MPDAASFTAIVQTLAKQFSWCHTPVCKGEPPMNKIACFVALVVAAIGMTGCFSTPAPREARDVPVISLGTPVSPSTNSFDRTVGIVVARYPFLVVSETRPGRHVIDWTYRRYNISGRTVFELTNKAVILRPIEFHDSGRSDALCAYDRLMRKIGSEVLGGLPL